MKNKIILLLFISICVTRLGFSQYADFKHFSTDMGLAGSEVYCQLVDSAGYMWFGTSKGLSRYDGYKFINFSASDGLPSNSIIKMFYDRFGRIWFATYDGLLSYYSNDKFYKFEFNDTLAVLSQNYYISNILIDNDTNMYVMPSLGGVYVFTKNGDIIDKTPKTNEDCFYFKDFGNGLIFNKLRGNNKVADSVYIEQKDDTYFLYGIDFGFRFNIIKIDDNEFMLSVGKNVFYILDGKISYRYKFDNEVSGLYCDNEANLWISVLYEGVYFFSQRNLNSVPEIYLSGTAPIVVCQDFQNGYWLPTTENGVFYSPSFQFISYNKFGIPLFNILSIHIVNNTLYFSTFDKQVIKSKINKHKIMSIENLFLLKDKNYAIHDIISLPDSSVWFLGDELIKGYGEGVPIARLSKSYKLYNVEDMIYVVSHEGLKIFKNGELYNSTYVKDFPTSNAIYVDDDKNIWVGTINGLYIFYDNKYKFLGDNNNLLKSRINDIAKCENYLVLATNGDGIFLFDPKSKKIKIINEKDNLNSNFINTVFYDKNDLWAGTSKGLCRINIVEHYDSLQIYLTKFTTVDGLYANEIKDIDKVDDCIYLGTTEGLISFYPDKLKKNLIPPKLFFDSILVNNSAVKINEHYKLKFGENTLSFFYKGISFNAGSNVMYKYKLDGYDDKWTITADRYVRFPNLHPGDYTFYLKASADGVVWNKQPIAVSFHIKNKFTHSLLFYILVFIVLAIIVFVIFTFRFSRMQKDLKINKQMIKLEQKALRSQMNPHFIFNALNSIRRYILENDTDNADFYLTRFASLIRKVLDNSKLEFITLDEEIETLRLYIELEKMRFDDSFTFLIETDKMLRINIFNIPPMIIQPIVENAIWHGLAPLQKNGHLNITFLEADENSFICVVEDNGIGRKKAEETAKKRKGHKSTGVKNLQERINLLNAVGTIDIDYKVFDLFDADNNPTGTKVELHFKHKAHTVRKSLFLRI